MMSCGQFNMLRMAPSSIMAIIPPSSKPKIGFSIDSIVGNSEFRGHGADLSCFSPRSDSPDRPSSSLSDYSYPLELRNSDSQIQSNSIHINEITTNRGQTMAPTSDFHRNFTVNMPECSPNSQDSIINLRQIHSNSPTRVQSPLSPQVPERPVVQNQTPSPPLATSILKCPIIVPGIPAGLIRPFPIQQTNSEIKHHIPPYFNTQDMVGSPNPHILAAQFQMAAALAHGQTNQIFSPGSGLHNHHHHHHPQFSNHSLVRDSYPLYPWLISRHGRIFPHRIPGNFLLQPFRKPKRVRTAFSPSQLLKLEHAFENNHYVVGAERKSLAQTLSLTETQVKVWFQNRRTKHKRMQQEEDAKNCGSNNGGNDNGDQKNFMGDSSTQASFDDEEDEDEDELIDMDDCSSDQESDQIQ